MHKTIYVDVDEEITSILDRIRNEEENNVVLVVPKDAMLTQGVINLKLLKKETGALGKLVTIATNDKYARKVIEKLEIRTKDAEGSLGSNLSKNDARDAVSKQAVDEAINMIEDGKNEKESMQIDNVGSSGFYDQIGDGETIKTTTPKDEMEENGKPKQENKTNMLTPNALRKDLYKRKREKKQEIVDNRVASAVLRESPRTSMGRSASQMHAQPQMDLNSRQYKMSPEGGVPVSKIPVQSVGRREESVETNNNAQLERRKIVQKAEKFFAKERSPERKMDTMEPVASIGRKPKSIKFWTFLIVILVLLGAIAGVTSWAYVNYPKASVVVAAKKQVVSKEIKLIAQEGVDVMQSNDGKILGELIEIEISKSMDYNSTGETYASDDGKARGVVTIYNKYSSSAQPLVERTRLLSKEGKLFRLINGVVVPGMSGENPGKIEVEVIADAPGEDFNIGSSTFTIEGFKSGPKYKKFEVSSSKTMTEGGKPDSAKKMAMVTEQDVANAREKTIDLIEQSIEQEIENRLGEGKKVIVDSVEREIEESKSTHKAKDVAKTFTYAITQKIKAIVFDIEDVNFVVMQELESEVQEGYVLDSVGQVIFKKGIADYENKTLTMYVDAETASWPKLEKKEIVKGIAGKNEGEIKSFLSTYPSIEKVEITITPSWLTTVPVSENKIEIIEKQE